MAKQIPVAYGSRGGTTIVIVSMVQKAYIYAGNKDRYYKRIYMVLKAVDINPDILRWARETAGMTIADAVRKLHRKRVTEDTMAAWESGTEQPSYAQLERLAYHVYKRPLAVFFFPAPPTEVTPKQSFRTLPDAEIDRMAPRIHSLVRFARAMQVNLSELSAGFIHEVKPLPTIHGFDASSSVKSMVGSVRASLAIELSTQKSWSDTAQAFKEWRSRLQAVGVYVFKEAFRIQELSGFCLFDERYPVIVVNNTKPHSRQIFTLFHELAHLLFRTGGIDARLDDYLYLLKGRAREIEIKCNQFAAEFLVPDLDFRRNLGSLEATEESISQWADVYKVSREVILRKLFDLGVVEDSRYQKLARKWMDESLTGGRSGGNYYLNQATYLGKYYLELAFRNYHQGRISRDQLADYLQVKPKSVVGMENVLLGIGG